MNGKSSHESMILSYRNMFVVLSVTLLLLLPAGQSSPLTCKELLQPLDQLDPHHVAGRWDLVAGSLSDPALLEFFKERDSSSIYFSNATATSNISYSTFVHIDGKCHDRTYNISLEVSTIVFDVRHQINLTLTMIHTPCADCVVMRFDNESKKAERLWLFSRRREVETKELEEFRAQVECLNMLPPAVMDPNKELCELGIRTEDNEQA
ncbi:uncharacterized protein [Leuresthes tenuis]|uniref:uncharacterized protein n=1 Tax=Leuresthes tenuis TaxID=355514 RepID=UPI003B510351